MTEGGHGRRRRAWSVRAYLVAGFGSCLASVVGLVAYTTTADVDPTTHAQSTVALGVVIAAFVAGLGVVLHHRLAMPVRRLERAINRAADGVVTATVDPAGPREVADVGTAFNHLLSERHRLEADLRHRARHDPLTGLPNRLELGESLNWLLATDLPVAVLFLDLDRFKQINDRHGHALGDQVLVALGERLRVGCPSSTVYRFGGDEFVVVCQGADQPAAVRAAGLVADALAEPVRVDGQELYVHGSVGISTARPGETADEVIAHADTAMYRAKELGRGRYAVFDEAMRAWSASRLDIETGLLRGLDRDEFDLLYEPRVALTDHDTVGAEALLRWRHPERGVLAPKDFLDVAEESGLVLPIDEWVVGRAAAQAAAWRAAGTPLPLSVNLGARHLARPDLPAVLTMFLAAAGARPEDLVVEFTEAALTADVDGAAVRLAALRAEGVSVAIDGFGTGRSALRDLGSLPLDELKIDRSLVAGLGAACSRTLALVEGLVTLAHALGMRVVADGVEQPEQLRRVVEAGCDAAQGYLLGRPGPPELVTAPTKTGRLPVRVLQYPNGESVG